jgi:hypothetical protein
MTFELRVNPFTQDFQRLIDFVHWLDSRKIVIVRLGLILNASHALPTPFSSYFRGAYFTDTPTVSHVDDASAYQLTAITPHSWSLALVASSVDPDCVRFAAAPAHTEFALAHLLAEGTADHPGANLEMATAALRGVVARSGYFQLPLAPGEFLVEFSRDAVLVCRVLIGVQTFARTNFATHFASPMGPLQWGGGSAPSRVQVLLAAGGAFSEHLAKMTVLSVLRSARAPVDVWVLGRGCTAAFSRDLAVLARPFGAGCRVLDYEWPGALSPPAERARAAALSPFLLMDLALPLAVHRVVALEPGALVLGDLAELMRMDIGRAPCAVAADAARVDIAVIDLTRWRFDGLGERLRAWYGAAAGVIGGRLEEELYAALKGFGAQVALPESWEGCGAQSRLRGANVIGACRSPVSNRTEVGILRKNAHAWRKTEEEINAFERDQEEAETHKM